MVPLPSTKADRWHITRLTPFLLVFLASCSENTEVPLKYVIGEPPYSAMFEPNTVQKDVLSPLGANFTAFGEPKADENCFIKNLHESEKEILLYEVKKERPWKYYTGYIKNSKGDYSYTDGKSIYSRGKYYETRDGDWVESFLIRNCIYSGNQHIGLHFPKDPGLQ